MDVVSPKTCSRIMAAIRAKHTKPEREVRSFLYRCGLRFRLHKRSLPGCPALVFPARHIALFVHGCFWHHHYCRRARLPGHAKITGVLN